jgi:VIT1/CCC1 family predicted Fe2+/Mn2+ transporter
MDKFHQKTEEGILVIVALFVLVSSMLNTIVSIVLAVLSLSAFFAYNLLTKKK